MTQKFPIKMQISTIKNLNLDKPSRNPSNRTIVKIILAKIEGKEAKKFSKIYEWHLAPLRNTEFHGRRNFKDTNPLKVHKHEIILNFFFTQIKSLYALRKFLKKNSLLFLWFSPEFRCSNISAVTEHTRNQIFFERYPKIFFSKSSLWSY